MTQSIRPSQFITTYGPGTILESKDGPVMILRPDIGIFNKRSGLVPTDFEIDNRQYA